MTEKERNRRQRQRILDYYRRNLSQPFWEAVKEKTPRKYIVFHPQLWLFKLAYT